MASQLLGEPPGTWHRLRRTATNLVWSSAHAALRSRARDEVLSAAHEGLLDQVAVLSFEVPPGIGRAVPASISMELATRLFKAQQ